MDSIDSVHGGCFHLRVIFNAILAALAPEAGLFDPTSPVEYGWSVFRTQRVHNLFSLHSNLLSADFVLVGRPALWVLAYNGQEGIETAMTFWSASSVGPWPWAGQKN